MFFPKFKQLILSFFILPLMMTALQAKTFTSQYCEFELPPGWECALEGTEWVCQSVNKSRKKEAIIILAAKIRGSQDELAKYQAYLKKPKTFNLPGGKTQVSEAKYTKMNKVNEQMWVDSLHMASEVPGFYTRYMATVKEDLGIAVTFSVAKDHYEAYQDLFDKIIQTLKVFRQKNVKAGNFKLAGGGKGDLLDAPVIPDSDNLNNIGYKQRKKSSGGGDSTTDYLIYALVAGGAVFALSKMRKKKDPKGGKKKKKKKKTSKKKE